jgi:hypothetical protein
MDYEIPLPLKEEHEALHERLRRFTRAGGEIGELAKALARLMHPHFVKEDEMALPPLGLLAALATGEATPDMAGVLDLTDRLEAELPSMLAEHRVIVDAIQQLEQAARKADRADVLDFARHLTDHARTEEAVMYPAAILVGKFVRLRLGQAA